MVYFSIIMVVYFSIIIYNYGTEERDYYRVIPVTGCIGYPAGGSRIARDTCLRGTECRRHRLALPAVLHQAESSLSARHFAEYLFPRVGNRYSLGLVSGICLFLRAAHSLDLYSAGYHFSGIGTLPFLYTRLVCEA